MTKLVKVRALKRLVLRDFEKPVEPGQEFEADGAWAMWAEQQGLVERVIEEKEEKAEHKTKEEKQVKSRKTKGK